MKNRISNVVSSDKYVLNLKPAINYSVISFTLIIFLIYFWIKSNSWIFLIISIAPLVVLIAFIYPIILKQSVEISGNSVVFSFRYKPSLRANIADSLYQIVEKDGELEHFRFKINSHDLQITPLGYINGEKLLNQLKAIIKKRVSCRICG